MQPGLTRRRTIRCAAAAISLMSVTSIGHAFDTLFDTWTGFVTGDYQTARFPYAVKTGDVTGDGVADALVARWPWATGFALLEGRGDGSFEVAVRYASALPALELELADLDLDGDLDVVVPNTGYNYEGTTVSVFLNDGSGSFGPQTQFALNSRAPFGVVATDFNGDGLPDLAVANYGWIGQGNTVDLLLGDGTGSFGSAVAYPSGEGPCKIVAGDVNGDGFPDLATGNDSYPHSATILLNSNGGGFAAPTTYTAAIGVVGSYAAVALSDLENDGDLDLLFSNPGTRSGDSGAVVIFRNQGGGVMGPMEVLSLVVYTAGPRDLAVVDVTGDGWVDVLGAHWSGRASDGWELAVNDGTGHFLDPVLYAAGQATVGVAVADVDADGDTDVLTADNYSMEVTAHENLGDGTFQVPPVYPTVPVSLYLDAGDMDGDGDLDILTTGGVTYPVAAAVLLNQGDGTFPSYDPIIPPYETCFGKLRDLNGDGRLDILMAGGPPYPFYTALGNGDGTFGPVTEWPVASCGAGDIDAFDLDNDGDLDVCYLEYLGCPSGGANQVFISRNHGDGTFAAPYSIQVDIGPYQIAGGDFDQDGNLDLATAHYGYYGSVNRVNVLLGNGNGTFAPRASYVVPNGPKDILAADLSGDGILDLATCNTGGNVGAVETMSVLMGTGAGTFLGADVYDAAYSPDLLAVNGITAGDPDGDGDLDLMVSNSGANDVSYYENHGDGSFEDQIRFGVGWSAWSATYADFTGDGVGDIAACVGLPPSGLDGGVAIVAGIGTPTVVVGTASPSARFVLGPATPNPFRSRVHLSYQAAGTDGVQFQVFDAAGRVVFAQDIVESRAGWQTISWDGRTAAGSRVAPGLYFLRLQSEAGAANRKVLLVK